MHFDGGYIAGVYTLLGSRRRWNSDDGVWKPTSSGEGFSPGGGRWGTVGAVVRYLTARLADADVRGGRQRTWMLGANYCPVLLLRLTAEFLQVNVTGGPSLRTVKAFASRSAIQF